MQTISATPKKLKSGAWGALAKTESVRTGDTLQITTRAGKSWTATVSKVLWSGKGIAICATGSRANHRRTRNGECDCGACEDLLSMGYGHMAGQRIRCPECGGWADVC